MEVANRLNNSERTVSRILKRWTERRDVEKTRRPGRPKTVSQRSDRVLSRIVKTNRRAS